MGGVGDDGLVAGWSRVGYGLVTGWFAVGQLRAGHLVEDLVPSLQHRRHEQRAAGGEDDVISGAAVGLRAGYS